MPSVTLAPYEQRQYLDDNGNPLALGQVFTYASGTSTPAVTYRDAVGTPNTNPIILDSGGRCIIYLAALSYKFILKDLNGVVIGNTMDPVASVGLLAGGGAYEIFTFGGDSSSPIVATTYPSGSGVDKTHAGTGLFVIDPANIASGTYVINAMVLGAGTVSVAIVDLLAGSPDVPLAVASGSSATGAAVQSAAITFPMGGVAHSFGIKVQVSSGSGFAWGINLAKIG